MTHEEAQGFARMYFDPSDEAFAKCVGAVLASHSPIEAAAQPMLDKKEARQLAAGLIDYAEGRIKSLQEIRADFADADTRKDSGRFSDQRLQTSAPEIEHTDH